MREDTEQREKETLSPRACRAELSRGRGREEAPCGTRTVFQRDIDRITYSGSFRRLMHKTQVFLNPEGDHYRTRMTHTLEVARIARTLARGLALNEDLAEAIALGHDLGHTPFGHAGEAALDGVMEGGFSHRKQSLRVVDRVEKDGRGLNLTAEVRDGILHHSGSDLPETLEGMLVRYSDRIAYLNHDREDAIRAGILQKSDIPRQVRDVLGASPRESVDTLVRDLLHHSRDADFPRMSEACEEAMNQLRAFMFERVYFSKLAKSEEGKAREMLLRLFAYYCAHPGELPQEFQAIAEEEGAPRAVCDYVAGMTDRYATARAMDLFIPRGWDRL